MTYEEAIGYLRQVEMTGRPDVGLPLATIEANHDLMIFRWKHWRDFAKRLWSICHEGGRRGMPADLWTKDEYRQMKNYLAECGRFDTYTTEQVAKDIENGPPSP